MSRNSRYLQDQFSYVPEDVSDILVFGFNKGYEENGIKYTYFKPVNSRTNILFALSDNNIIGYIFHPGSNPTCRKIWKFTITEQYQKELGEIFNCYYVDSTLSVFARLYRVFGSLNAQQSMIRAKVNKRRLQSVYSVDEENHSVTFLSVYQCDDNEKKKEPLIIGSIPTEIISTINNDGIPRYKDFIYYKHHKTRILYREDLRGDITCFVYDTNRFKKHKICASFLNSFRMKFSISKIPEVLEWMTKHRLWSKRENEPHKLIYKTFVIIIKDTESGIRMFLGCYNKKG